MLFQPGVDVRLGEVFVERVPFAETRDRTRIAQRGLELARAPYPASELPGAAGG